MSSANLNRYIKEYLKRQPKTLSMSQIEELIEYDAWLDTQSGITQRALDGALCTCKIMSSVIGDNHAEDCALHYPPRQ